MPKAFWNGEYIDESDIRISPRDLGLLRGYAVFDVMMAYHGRPFLSDRHFARLVRSAEALRLQLPLGAAEFATVAAELVRQAGGDDATIRTVLSGGTSDNSFRPQPGQETFFMLIEPTHAPNPSVYLGGVRLMTLEFERSLPQVKFANHAIAIQDLDRRDALEAFETLYVSGGQVSECSQSNLFWVQGGQVFTTWDNVLWGITQGLVMELAASMGKWIMKKTVTLDELVQADEVFITGSSKGLVPVVGIDEHVIGDGTVGPSTAALMAAYRQYCEKY